MSNSMMMTKKHLPFADALMLDGKIESRVANERTAQAERHASLDGVPVEPILATATRASQKLDRLFVEWESARERFTSASDAAESAADALGHAETSVNAAEKAWAEGSLDRDDALKRAADLEVARAACRAHAARHGHAIATMQRESRVVGESEHPWERQLRAARDEVADAIRWFAEDPTNEGIEAAVGRLRRGLEKVGRSAELLSAPELIALAICLETHDAKLRDKFKSRVRRQADTTPRTVEIWWDLVVVPALAQQPRLQEWSARQ